MNLGKTALYYKSNPKARAKKASYDRQFQKKKKQVKKRVECNAWNRKYGKKGDKIDCSHKNGTIVAEHRKRNRARGGAKRL
tara:strand:- start:15 stop:257 length:243 start_codon:yes stop_codon:yes gene_type:complete